MLRRLLRDRMYWCPDEVQIIEDPVGRVCEGGRGGAGTRGGGERVQSEEEILARVDVIPEMNQLMARFLDEVERRYGV